MLLEADRGSISCTHTVLFLHSSTWIINAIYKEQASCMRAGCGVAQRQSSAPEACMQGLSIPPSWLNVSPISSNTVKSWGTSLVGQPREGGWKGIITSYQIKDGTYVKMCQTFWLTPFNENFMKSHWKKCLPVLALYKNLSTRRVIVWYHFLGSQGKNLSLSHRQFPPQWPLLLLYWRTEATAGSGRGMRQRVAALALYSVPGGAWHQGCARVYVVSGYVVPSHLWPLECGLLLF